MKSALSFCIILIVILSASCTQTNKSLKRKPFPHSLSQYTVVKGDTLFSIAYRAETTVNQLAQLNQIRTPYTLFPGQKIRLRSKPRIQPPKTDRSRNSKASISHSKNTPLAVISKKNLKNRWRWPTTGIVVKGFNQTGRKGIDIAGKLGDTVLAAASGKVVYSGPGLLGYGNLIIIKHDLHFLTAYANNRRLFVKEGQSVKKRQRIAEVGVLSGKKPSLHFEIRHDGKPVNPLMYLPKR